MTDNYPVTIVNSKWAIVHYPEGETFKSRIEKFNGFFKNQDTAETVKTENDMNDGWYIFGYITLSGGYQPKDFYEKPTWQSNYKDDYIPKAVLRKAG